MVTTLAFDGPGQGEALYRHGIAMIRDREAQAPLQSGDVA
jgi:hypothetical protein